MTTISEFISGQKLEETIVTNSSLYRKKFSLLVQKAGVGDRNIDDRQAIRKIRETVSWNWAGFFFAESWGVYRKQKIAWILWSVSIVLKLMANVDGLMLFGFIAGVFSVCLSLIFGMYGNGVLLTNAMIVSEQEIPPESKEQLSMNGLWLLVFLSVLLGLVGYGLSKFHGG